MYLYSHRATTVKVSRALELKLKKSTVIVYHYQLVYLCSRTQNVSFRYSTINQQSCSFVVVLLTNMQLRVVLYYFGRYFLAPVGTRVFPVCQHQQLGSNVIP